MGRYSLRSVVETATMWVFLSNLLLRSNPWYPLLTQVSQGFATVLGTRCWQFLLSRRTFRHCFRMCPLLPHLLQGPNIFLVSSCVSCCVGSSMFCEFLVMLIRVLIVLLPKVRTIIATVVGSPVGSIFSSFFLRISFGWGLSTSTTICVI